MSQLLTTCFVPGTNYDSAPNPAGIIASFRASNNALQVSYDWYTGQFIPPWKVMNPVPDNFASPTLDDSAWPTAVTEAAYGGGPWGSLRTPVPASLCI
jgi:hypothetical protein